MRNNFSQTIDWSDIIIASPMSENDLPETMEIEKTTVYSPWSRDMFLSEIERENPGMVVFKAQNKLIGYLCFWKVLDEAHLLSVCLHFDFRGKGLGEFLMNYLEKKCKKMGLSRILLEVAATNYQAIKLYKKCGFVKMGLRKKFYKETGDDAILMEKLIQANSVP
ncbi:MAG: ribosomal protein S18-alanine N-acetyltransferase [Pseudomonadota bacterium]